MRSLAVAIAVVVLVPATAGAAPTAAEVIAGVDKAYAAIKSAELEFDQEHFDKAFGTTTPSRGRGWVLRPDRMKWEYLSKPAKRRPSVPIRVFASDGKTLTIVDHKTKQVIHRAIDTDAMPAALSFLTGKGTLATGFTAKLGATTATSITLELTPTKASVAYAKLTLVVDPATYQVQASIVEDADGNTNKFTFPSMKTGATIDAKQLAVDLKAKGVRDYEVVKPKP
jgi:outer membrane lipoprotein-sorting protein